MHALTADVAVIGGGLSGLATAVRAGEHGLRAVVLEKLDDERYVCNSRLTTGIFHFAFRSLNTEVATLRSAILEATDHHARPELVEAITADLLRAVRWLQSFGVRFIRSSSAEYQSFILAPPAVPQPARQWRGRGGDVLLPLLEARLVAQRGQLLRGHRVTRLVMDGTRCAGVEGVALGVPFRVSAGVTVIADGGFQANLDELRAHVSPAPERLVQRNARTGVGDGLAMAAAVGARLTERSKFYGHVISRSALENDALWPYPWLDELARGSMLVGADGRRFADEGEGGVFLANAIAALRDPAGCVVIADQDAWDTLGCERPLSPNPYLERLGGTVHRAATIASLAAQAALPAAALVDEVERYNQALATDSLAALTPARSTRRFRAWPIRRAPFYAIPAAAGITYTMGGIAIDAHARVLDQTDRSIAGLYAVGSCTGGLEGGPRAGYAGGLVKATTTGLRAGEHIASILK